MPSSLPLTLTHSEFEQLLNSVFARLTFMKSVPGFAHGKMYKRNTFGIGPPLGTRSCLCVFVAKNEEEEMVKKENEVRTKMVIVRMNESEYKQLEELHSKSTHKYLSIYARKVLLQKPVVLKYRNQSADEFLREMVDLKKQLNGIGNNFNQAVHRLHMVEKIPEFRMWILNNEQMQRTIIEKTKEIETRMRLIYDQLNKTVS